VKASLSRYSSQGNEPAGRLVAARLPSGIPTRQALSSRPLLAGINVRNHASRYAPACGASNGDWNAASCHPCILSADARSSHVQRLSFGVQRTPSPACQVNPCGEAGSDNPVHELPCGHEALASCRGCGLRACWRYGVRLRFCQSRAELFAEPVEDRPLFVLPSFPDLGE